MFTTQLKNNILYTMAEDDDGLRGVAVGSSWIFYCSEVIPVNILVHPQWSQSIFWWSRWVIPVNILVDPSDPSQK